jgi:hypothetical protein
VNRCIIIFSETSFLILGLIRGQGGQPNSNRLVISKTASINFLSA